MKDNIVLQVSISSKKKETFKELAKKQGYTISGLVNKLIEEYIKKNKVEE